MTRTYATMEISAAAFDEIASKLQVARYEWAIIVRVDNSILLDMNGIALVRESTTPGEAIRKGFE